MPKAYTAVACWTPGSLSAGLTAGKEWHGMVWYGIVEVRGFGYCNSTQMCTMIGSSWARDMTKAE